MLVLSREQNEAITIITPEGIEVEVINLGYRKGRMKVGVIAPSNIIVQRNELLNPQKNPYSQAMRKN